MKIRWNLSRKWVWVTVLRELDPSIERRDSRSAELKKFRVRTTSSRVRRVNVYYATSAIIAWKFLSGSGGSAKYRALRALRADKLRREININERAQSRN